MLFERLTEDEPEEQRCWFESVSAQDVSDPTEASCEQQFERTVIQRVNAQATGSRPSCPW